MIEMFIIMGNLMEYFIEKLFHIPFESLFFT